MARYTGPRVRVSRRIGFNVFENRKGDKALQDRPYPPGENGKKRMRETDYGTQLKEKQKVRYMYGVMEKQFRNYYKEATRMPGITGENLLVLLESRIDKGKGPVSTVLIRNGKLKRGDYFICGDTWGKIRAMINYEGKNIDEALPSMPVEILGMNSSAFAGAEFLVTKDENEAREKTKLAYEYYKRFDNMFIRV